MFTQVSEDFLDLSHAKITFKKYFYFLRRGGVAEGEGKKVLSRLALSAEPDLGLHLETL